MPDNGKREHTHSTGSRRTYLKYAGLAATMGLAGCSGGGGSGGSDSGGSSGGSSGGADGGGSSGGGDSGGSTGGETTGSSSSSGDEFVIGSNHPLSGSLAYTGESMHRAVKFAAKQKNEAGGIESLDGAAVKVVKGDNQAKQSLAAQVEQQLIKDGAQVLTGCFNSDATMAATAVAEREQIPHVIDVAASDRILKGRDMNYVYRLQPTTFHYARDWVKFYPEIIRNAGNDIKTVGHYYIDNAYGSEIHDYLKNTFIPDSKLELVESTSVTLDQTNASSQVTKLRQADPDCICVTGYQQDAQMLMDSMNNADYRPKWLSASASVAFVSADFVKKLGKGANGVMDANYALNHNNQITEKFSKNYQNYADRDATPEAALAWASTQVIFDAVERAGTTDPKKLNQAIAKTEMGPKQTPLAMEGVAFKESGENKHALAAMNQVREMEPKVVYPEKYAQMKPNVKPGET